MTNKPAKKLTDSIARDLPLPPGRTEAFAWDSDIPGFGVRLRAKGNRTWMFQYRHAGRTKRITIGLVSAIKAVDARSSASKLYAQMKLGVDPGAGRDSPRGQDETFAATVDLYLARQRDRLRPGSYVNVQRHLLTNAKPLHRTPLTEIDRRAVARLIAALGVSSGKVAANAVLKDICALYSWAIREGLADLNPAAGANRFEERSRERVLTNDELARIWKATEVDDAARANERGEWLNFCALVRLLILTGARRQELGALKWSEVDNLLKATISLPGERTKNARPHMIPLSGAAIAILQSASSQNGGGEFVFGRAGFKGWNRMKRELDKRSGTSGWTLHDTRRTISTALHEDLDVAPHIVEGVLGHTIKGVAGIYNKSLYLDQRRIALEARATRLAAIVEGREPASNVVSILQNYPHSERH